MSAAVNAPAHAGEWIGRDLGTRTVSWTDRDAILYALAVGAPADRLDLVFEDRMRVLPTFALTLAQWAPDVLAEAGAWEVATALHGSQKLTVLGEIPIAGEMEMSARVANVWDKGAAAVFEIEVTSPYVVATWSIFAPGAGGFGGERGPSRPAGPEGEATGSGSLTVAENSAALYRLTGDRHHIHIDPVAAQASGQPKPFLQGLATVASATLVLADAAGVHPADLTSLEGRFSSVVFPGEELTVSTWDSAETGETLFTVATERGVAIDGGRVSFR
ncbi:MaoC/PaaZ C-terminal domain-containing protein [Nocardioides sp.]|uniref:MaoC/PaaZ C-terminal domain-containing protein n=1 Tax=Nocardioides sp. TaxID=35761 RepID=UPI002630F72A|nr:MaoC/PaaZ C-terminal domain-containing protein [Nocardioides sp.]